MTIAPPDLATERLAELHELAQLGKLRQWARPVVETLTRAGYSGDPASDPWADWPWYGPLQPWIVRPTVAAILINGPDTELIVVEGGQRLPTGVVLHPEWIAFVQRQLLWRAGLVPPAAPDDWRDPHGAPTAMLLGTADRHLRFVLTRPPLTPSGPTVALRVLPRRWRTLDDLVLEQTLPRAAAEVLLAALRSGVSVLIAGGGGSGKTTLMAALLTAIGQERRVIVIEEAGELPHLPDSVHLETLRSGQSFAACVRFALRQQPEVLGVGEVRGEEALALLHAAALGYPGVSTIHAPDVQTALTTLERMAGEGSEALATVRGLLSSRAVPLLVAHVGRYGGNRRVGQIEEVVPLGAAGQRGERYPTNVLFAYDPQTDQVRQRGYVQGGWGSAAQKGLP